MPMQKIGPSPAPSNAAELCDENFDSLSHQAVYGKRPAATTGLTWGYYDGRWGGFAISAGTLTLTNAATNYIVVARATGVISTSTTTTNWDDTNAYARVYKIVTSGGLVSGTPEDHRAGPFGVHGQRPLGRRINAQSAAYTCVLADQDAIILHPSADTTARTFTIPANSSVPYSPGTRLEFVNQNAAGVLTIAITTDTMRLAGAGTTGSRTLAANGRATAEKLTATEWLISGTGLT